MSKAHTPLPPWIKKRLGSGSGYVRTEQYLDTLGVETICTQAKCPNQGECWARGTATVLILGNICTRNCGFCSVSHGRPQPPDPREPERISKLAGKLGISYLVITSVDRDDLSDGGAGQFRDVVLRCREDHPRMEFELLVPDFKGVREQALDALEEALPFVFGHNVETVPDLYHKARPGGDYRLSLELLERAKQRRREVETKSSLMLGLGETEDQVLQVLADLREVGVDRLCLGQYLKPSRESLDVAEFVTPKKFRWWKDQAESLGFTWVISEPFARSSYHADGKI